MGFIEKTAVLLAVSLAVVAPNAGANEKAAAGKIPITTKSAEARALYVKGRALFETLRAVDARKQFQLAVAKDKDFALAHFMLANTSQSNQEFFDELGKAVALADKVSEPERLLIRGLDAGAKGDVATQKEVALKLVEVVPNDERAHNNLAGYYFGQQNYAESVAEYEKAVKIDPKFSQPYNQLGYAYRAMDNYADAERIFKKYIELIPNDPNPYDSYAELLMKMGRFDESIKNYEKALKVDPNFTASYIGIGNNQMFMGHGPEARQAFARLMSVARTDGEKRTALFWTAVSFIDDGKYDEALGEAKKEAAIAEASKDLGNLAADHAFMGNIYLAAGQPDEAAAEFAQQLEINGRSQVPDVNKQQVRRNDLFNQGRVAIAKKDIAGARKIADEYAKQVADKKILFELWQSRELNGMVAIEENHYADAVSELTQSNQQDPRVLYLTAVALQGAGDVQKAKAICAKAADFNALAFDLAYVRKSAKDLLGKLVG
jgi:tetratricopeptide (TPR) repeat protein